MARGGKRPGAGRKRGTINRRTREVAERVAKTGLTPLDYMLTVMRDPKADQDRRDEMAKAAAPFCHARLAAVEHGATEGGGAITFTWQPTQG